MQPALACDAGNAIRTLERLLAGQATWSTRFPGSSGTSTLPPSHPDLADLVGDVDHLAARRPVDFCGKVMRAASRPNGMARRRSGEPSRSPAASVCRCGGFRRDRRPGSRQPAGCCARQPPGSGSAHRWPADAGGSPPRAHALSRTARWLTDNAWLTEPGKVWESSTRSAFYSVAQNFREPKGHSFRNFIMGLTLREVTQCAKIR